MSMNVQINEENIMKNEVLHGLKALVNCNGET